MEVVLLSLFQNNLIPSEVVLVKYLFIAYLYENLWCGYSGRVCSIDLKTTRST